MCRCVGLTMYMIKTSSSEIPNACAPTIFGEKIPIILLVIATFSFLWQFWTIAPTPIIIVFVASTFILRHPTKERGQQVSLHWVIVALWDTETKDLVDIVNRPIYHNHWWLGLFPWNLLFCSFQMLYERHTNKLNSSVIKLWA